MTDYDKLEPQRMIIVGAGGSGSWLAMGLGRMLSYRAPGSALILVDGDHYEPRNAERQHMLDLGNKAEVLADHLQPLLPDTFIIADPRWVVKESDAKIGDMESDSVAASTLIQEGDVVFTCVDNFAARKIIFDHAKTLDNIDVFHGGNDEHLFVSTYHYARREGRDLVDHPADWHPELIDPPDRNPGEMSCQERAELEGSTQTIAANMMVGAALLARVHETMFEGKQDEISEIFIDMAVGLANPFDRRVEDEQGAPAEQEESDQLVKA